MFMLFCHQIHHWILYWLIILFTFNYGLTCPMNYCTNNYKSGIDKGIIQESSINYCELIVDTMKCLEELESKCNSQDLLKIKTIRSGFKKRFNEYSCANYNISQYRQRTYCPVWPEEHDPSRQYVCSIFGYPHLRTFHNTFETCTNQGAYPLIDNPFFLIQVTNAQQEIKNGITGLALTKITLLIKNKSGCTDQKIYEANRNDRVLQKSFVDGYTSTGINNTITIETHSDYHVEIKMHDISTVIHFRREGPYLGVSLRIPQRLFELLNEDIQPKQMCLHGCGSNSSISLPNVLAHPYDYINQCSPFQAPLVQPKLAEDHCKYIDVTDDFFDACVFDQITSEVKMANLIKLVEKDCLRLLQRRKYVSGRQSLVQYSRIPKKEFKCDPVEKSQSSYLRFSFIVIIICILFL